MYTITKKTCWIAATLLFVGILQIHAQIGNFCTGTTSSTPIFVEDFGNAPSTTPQFVTLASVSGATTTYAFDGIGVVDSDPTTPAINDGDLNLGCLTVLQMQKTHPYPHE